MIEPYRQDKQKYFILLRELILNKQDSEIGSSHEDKLDDLKKDLVNEMRKFETSYESKIDDLKKDLVNESKLDDLKKDLVNEMRKLLSDMKKD